jgi:hypothetical protein
MTAEYPHPRILQEGAHAINLGRIAWYVGDEMKRIIESNPTKRKAVVVAPADIWSGDTVWFEGMQEPLKQELLRRYPGTTITVRFKKGYTNVMGIMTCCCCCMINFDSLIVEISW